MKTFTALLKYTNPLLVGRQKDKKICKTVNTVRLINAYKRLLIQNQELVVQNQEKDKRATELNKINKELALQKIENSKKTDELNFVSKELEKAEKYQNDYVIGLKQIMHITSHNVRLPLANIIGISELLNQIDNSPEEINLCIGYLKQSVLSLETSTQELAFYIASLEQRSQSIQW